MAKTKTTTTRAKASRAKMEDKDSRFATTNAENNGQEKALALLTHKIREVVDNVQFSRSRLIKAAMDPRRSINDECGYPENEEITPDLYRRMYDREPVATRVVQVIPREAWQGQPTLFEDEDVEVETEFELRWKELDQQLRGKSWFNQEEGSLVWNYLQRVNEESGIGSYGVLLLGVNDGKPLKEELEFGKTKRKLLFLRVFDESLARITKFETDESSPRFGQPVEYSVSFNDPRDVPQASMGRTTDTLNVHWTRVIHISDGEVFAVPRMRPVWNRLLDLLKLYGGSAEMYWKGALPGYSIETHPQWQGPVDTEKARDTVEKWMNGLQRAMASSGMTVKSLAPQVVDPTPQIDTQIEAICIQLNVPKRKFTGSERGELASSQDTGDWNDTLRSYQHSFVTPNVIVPFVDRLIQVGVLPQPESYSVGWPNLDELSAIDQAAVALQRTEALAKYVGGGVMTLIPPADYLVRVIGFTQEETDAILVEAKLDLMEEMLTDEPEEKGNESKKPKDG